MQLRYPTREELLKEYELCQQSTQDIDHRIWTTSGVIGLASLASITLLAQSKLPDDDPF